MTVVHHPRSRALLLALSATIALGACKKGGDAPARRARYGADDSGQATASQGGGRGGASDAEEIRGYRLRMDKLQKMYAVQLRAAELAVKNGHMKDTTDAVSDNESLDDMARTLSSNPDIRQAISEVGLSSREYIVMGLAYMQAAMAGALAEQQHLDPDAAAAKAQANADNIRFVREHKAELQKMQQESQAKLQKLGVQ